MMCLKAARCWLASSTSVSFVHRCTSPQFIEEVLNEGHLVRCLLRAWCCLRHEGDSTFAVRSEIEGATVKSGVREGCCRPDARFVDDEGVASHGIARHHDVIVIGTIEQLLLAVRPHRICAART